MYMVSGSAWWVTRLLFKAEFGILKQITGTLMGTAGVPAVPYIMRRAAGEGGAGARGKGHRPAGTLLPLRVSYEAGLAGVLRPGGSSGACPS